MPLAANIVLADAQATPVDHTFVPIGRDKNGVFWYEDQSAANAIGNWRISVDIKKPPSPLSGQNSEGRSNRVEIGLHEPVLETVSNSTVSGIAPAPTVAYTLRSLKQFILPERSILLDRKNLRKMSYNLENNSQVIAMVEGLEYIW
jgi:hypothetical protein